jgi:hypothetical protein
VTESKYRERAAENCPVCDGKGTYFNSHDVSVDPCYECERVARLCAQVAQESKQATQNYVGSLVFKHLKAQASGDENAEAEAWWALAAFAGLAELPPPKGE